jgi:hypothetical protein
MAAVTKIELVTPGRSGTEMAGRVPAVSNPLGFFTWLVALLGSVFTRSARVRLQIDESTKYAARATVTLTQASLTAGDKVIVAGVALTAKAGSATAASGEWSLDTGDTEAAASLVLAINAVEQLKRIVTATSSLGVVTIVAVTPGMGGNQIALQEIDASGGILRSGNYLAGGRDEASLPTVVGTFTNAPADTGTLTIGSVVLTAAASPSNESEFDNGTNGPTAVANLMACINAHSKLKGLVVASVGSTTSKINIQLLQGGRIGALVSVLDGLSNYTQDVASFAPVQTEAWVMSPVVCAVGSARADSQ